MINGLLTYLNLAFLSLISLFAPATVSVLLDGNHSVKAGESFVLTATIDKPKDVTNLSKLQLTFPEGFSVVSKDVDAGGQFTFFDQKVKVLWYSLPETEKITVSMTVTANGDIGIVNSAIKGKFSYVIGGERQTILLDDFKISTGNVVSEATTADVPTQKESKKGEITATRTLDKYSAAAGDKIKVELKINKGDLSGYAKVIESLPIGFSGKEFSEEKLNGAIFSAQGSEAKFLWSTIPPYEVIGLTYEIIVPSSASGKYTIEGYFSYLDVDKGNIKIAIDQTVINIVENPDEILATVEPNTEVVESIEEIDETEAITDAVDDLNEEINEPEKIEEVTVKELEIVEVAETTPKTSSPSSPAPSPSPIAETPSIQTTPTPQATQTPEISEPTESTPVAEVNTNSSVNYRVQICATRNAVNVNYFTKHHNFNEIINSNMHEGWHKFTVGEYSEYKQARDRRELIKQENKINGPFVTAYNTGTRITVQEALMLSGQQWYK